MAIVDTTRPPRDGEVDGAVGSYYFIDKEEMKRQKELGYFFEVGIHNDNLYGLVKTGSYLKMISKII